MFVALMSVWSAVSARGCAAEERARPGFLINMRLSKDERHMMICYDDDSAAFVSRLSGECPP